MANLKGKKLNDFEHCLLRPDTYIGSIENEKHDMWIYDDSIEGFVNKQIKYNHGLDRIIIEIFSNAIDNKFRSEEKKIKMTKIKVTVNKENGEISIWNDGLFIPIELTEFEYKNHKTKEVTIDKCYPAETYFGDFKSSTNYNDTEQRKTSGRNGIGAKATVCFSKSFEVEHTDPKKHKKFYQKYENNGTERSKPHITSYQGKTGYTKITFIPDYEKFGFTKGLSNDFYALIKKHTYDTAMLTGLNVTFNGDEQGETKIVIKDLIKYAKLFFPNSQMISFKSKDCQVVLVDEGIAPETETSDSVRHVSFVNGCPSIKGGTHIDAWRDNIFSSIVKAVNAKNTKAKLPKASAKELHPYFVMFVVTDVSNPKFNSQTKEELTSPTPKTIKLTDADITKICKWNFYELLKERLLAKMDKKANKTTKVSKKTLNLGTKGQEANWAGSNKSMGCTLHIVEGMSAKKFATTGFSVLENTNDANGVLALKGKFINVVKATTAQISNNEEVQLIRKVLGLQNGVDYSKDNNFEKLRYGRINILTDSDLDGHHIKGLVQAFFWKLYPSLLKREGFLMSLSTPLLVVKDKFFYSNEEYVDWQKTAKSKASAKYHKGLGTSTNKQAKECFEDNKITTYTLDGDEDAYMALGFEKEKTDARKDWLNRHLPEDSFTNNIKLEDVEDENNPIEIKRTELDDDNFYEGDMALSYFIDTRIRAFGLKALTRAIPSVMDGMKESQRKILFTFFKENITEEREKKVEQMSGKVSDVSGYHHGGASANQTIINMAQGFIGANNIPLLANSGQFGSRLDGGEASAPRYIFTFLEKITRVLFNETDDNILEYVVDDGMQVEPYWYMPILPMILINGADGIGMGFSTNIPTYNPTDIVAWIKNKIKSMTTKKNDKMEPLIPWARGFKGESYIENNKWITKGILREKKSGWWEISELPVGVWADKYKATILEGVSDTDKPKKAKPKPKVGAKRKSANKSICDDIVEKNIYNNNDEILYKIKVSKTFEPTLENMGLVKSYSLNNMYMLNEHGCPIKFGSAEEILEYYFPRRLIFYVHRKKYLLNVLNHRYKILKNRVKFLNAVVKQDIDIHLKIDELEKLLDSLKYDKICGMKHDDVGKLNYNYLLDMPIRSLTITTMEKYEKEMKQVKSDIDILKPKSASDLWIEDLDKFDIAYEEFIEIRKQRDETNDEKEHKKKKKNVKKD
jgi:DNA topoisomerase-2